jgi:Fe-S cluster assembly ATP-binding protein
MLTIENLHAAVEGKQILRGLDLHIGPGEVHAIMGPNGAGKSTLASVLIGREGYDLSGSVRFDDQDLLALSPEERAAAGIFLAFQHPIEIPGVGNMYFMRTALNAIRRARGEAELDGTDFLALAQERMKLVEMDQSFMTRSVNEGFSGGEKKRNEILQMAILQPELAVLDETDSGLDIDALRVVAKGILEVRRDRPELGVVLITHYQRLLHEIEPDHVHVLFEGRIVASGGPELAERLEREGYEGWRG